MSKHLIVTRSLLPCDGTTCGLRETALPEKLRSGSIALACTFNEVDSLAFEDPDLALDALADRLRMVDTEQRPAAVDRVLAADVLADRDSPAADVSAMDGFAVRMEMLQTASCLIVHTAQAGAPPIEMPRTGCVRIFTGALVPIGADAVVIREDTDETQAGR